MLYKMALVMVLLIIPSAWAESPTRTAGTTAPSEGRIIAYYNGDWRVVPQRVRYGFYRRLLQQTDKGFLVQDFYSETNTKQTDAFWITDQSLLTAAIVRHQNLKLMTWYPKGQKKTQYTYQNGHLKHLKSWYTNGQKRYEGDFKDRHKEGLWKAWYRNGQKVWEGVFKGDKRQDIWTYWNQAGKKVREAQFKDNEKIAQWTFDD